MFKIQLEKIRADEHEVRWQHEEDVDDCTNCKKTFEVLRRKVTTAKVLLSVVFIFFYSFIILQFPLFLLYIKLPYIIASCNILTTKYIIIPSIS